MSAAAVRYLFDRSGEARYYLVAGGVLYDAHDRALACLDQGQVLSLHGHHLGWFDGVVLRDVAGALVATTAQAAGHVDVELEAPKPVRFTPQPKATQLWPKAAPRERPQPQGRWSECAIEDALQPLLEG